MARYARDLAFAVADDDIRVSLAAAHALTTLNGDVRPDDANAARDRIRAAAASDDHLAAIRVLEAAAQTGDSSHAERAIDLLVSDTPSVAFAAGHYLRARGAADGRAALRGARNDGRSWVQAAAGARVPADGTGPTAVFGKVVSGEGWAYYSPVDAEIPLPGAVVTYEGPVSGTVSTDELGRFHVASMPPGRYTVTVTDDGHLLDTFATVIPAVQGAEDRGEPSPAPAPTVVRLHRHY
ncbi:MAG: carboxypeptidase-like regulatory domain-containing protein [Candidatus Poribacteria bacterium]